MMYNAYCLAQHDKNNKISFVAYPIFFENDKIAITTLTGFVNDEKPNHFNQFVNAKFIVKVGK